MRKAILPSIQSGYSIVELLIVIAVIGILALISVGQFNNSAQRGRDSERFSDITALKSHLDEQHQDSGAYPSTLNTTTLPRVNPEFLIDPSGSHIINAPPSTSEYEALQLANPTIGTNEYLYAPYPTGCVNNCVGYVLKTAIEVPTIDYDNPYILTGTYNN